jgi:subtilase family serine protease
MTDQADPHAAAAPHATRAARARAVRDLLQQTATRSQGPIRGLLAREQARGRVQRVVPLWVFNGLAVTATEPVVRALAARPDVREVRPDRVVPRPAPAPTSAVPASALSEWNIDQIRAPDVWDIDPAYTGAGAVVGSFDSGVDGTHPDLAPRYRGDDASSWFDPYGEHASPFDADGHGTHTTGIAVGGDAGGTNIGVAPGARWIAAKAWDDSGTGLVSVFHQIFEWFLAPGGDPALAPDVVNMSWGFADEGCITEFLPGVQAFRAADIFPAFAAGNEGPFPGSVRSPGAYAESFATGATDVFDDVALFSGRGPSPCDGGVKPDLAAPGDAITSTVPGGYATLSGTSMASPHVAGAVAVLRSINPAFTVDELEGFLIQGAMDLGPAGPDDDFGAGRLDLFQSAQLALGANPDQPHVTIVATTPTATEAGLVPGVFTVTRTGSTDTEMVVRYSVSGTATPGSDYVALPGTLTIPAGSATATIVVTPIDDPVVEVEETVVVSLRPDPAYFVGSPGRATVTIVSDEIPSDLVVSALAAPASAAAGDTITLTDTTKNQGGGPADPSTTRFYLSIDGTLDAADVVLGSRSVPGLAPGATHASATTVTIPPGTATGSYYVLAVADADHLVVESVETNNTASAVLRIGPDLTIAALSAPRTAGAGGALSVTDTTRNLGAGTAVASTTRFYLSSDAVLDAADLALGSRAVPALAAGASSTGTTALTVPAGTATGVYYLIAQADADQVVAETSEANNTALTPVQVGPDLVVTALTVPAGAGAGTTITVTDTTQNQGGGAAPASTTRFYLSTDFYWDAGDTPLGGRAVPALAAGASHTGTASLVIPAGTPAGSYYVVARADGDQLVAETEEGNNVTARPLAIGADLVILAVSVPAAGGAGSPITVTDTTKNLGPGPAGASTTRFYLSRDGLLDAGDTVLGSRTVPVLAAGVSHTASTAVTIPAGTAPGTYYVIALADADHVVAETVETNNVGAALIQIGPDLVVTALSAPPAVGAGATITVTDTTKNQGSGTADASVTRLYLSRDGTWDTGDVFLGSRAVAALAPGASSTASTVVTIPAGTAAGAYYVLARADADQVVAETLETNNVAAAAIQIGADLVVSAFAGPGTAGAGAAISLTDTTRNQGGGPAGASTTRFYLSTDGILDAGDVVLGSRAVPALAGAGSSAASTVVTLPATLATGLYYLIAQADADQMLGETSEVNNTSATTILVGPDLIVSALTVPATAGSGGAITLTDTTRNQGGGGAAASTTRFYLSRDGTLDAGDVALGGRAVPAQAAGASHTGSTVVTIPAATASGAYFIIARADADDAVPETLEGNNTTARAIQIGGDLVVSALTVPPTAGAGGTLTVTDTTKNQGAGAVEASTTGFYLSTNALLDGSDVWLGSRAVAALAAGATSTGSTVLTLPAGLAPGTYYVLAQADSGGVVAEAVESNNVSYAAVQIGADLVVSALSVPSGAGAGATITVTDTTKNQGGGAADATTTNLYLSGNAVLDASDVFLGSRAVPALGAGAVSTGSTVVTLPAGLAPGLYFVLAQADAGGLVAESIEANNVSYAVVQIGADLIVSALGVPSGAGAGATITVTDTTKNQGGGPADGSTTSFYLSTTPTVGAGSVWLGSRAIPALAAGATSAGSTPLVVPAGTAAGSYYLVARADDGAAVAETQEGNNTAFAVIAIGPDLTISLLTGPSSAGAGGTINVTDTTRNGGAGPADATTTAFYLSTNSVLDGADVLLGSRAVPALAAGATSTAATALVIPAGTAAGYYYLLAKADAGGVAAESQEGNNVNYTTIAIGPDLIVIPPSAPASAAAGATITVTETTRNVGGGAADASTTSFYLSANATLDAGDVLVGSRAVPTLAAGGASAGSTAVTIPAGTAAGTYYLIGKADAESVVAETVETNNTASTTIQVTP